MGYYEELMTTMSHESMTHLLPKVREPLSSVLHLSSFCPRSVTAVGQGHVARTHPKHCEFELDIQMVQIYVGVMKLIGNLNKIQDKLIFKSTLVLIT